MILSSDPVARAGFERKMQELLYEFYRYFFSGQPVDLAGQQVTFPLLAPTNYLFNQGPSQRPDTGPQIHTVSIDLRPAAMGADSTHRRVRTNASFTIYVRVWNPGQGYKQADHECRDWADNLARIWEGGTQALAQKGIHNSRIRRGPVPVATAGANTRMLVITASVHYESPY